MPAGPASPGCRTRSRCSTGSASPTCELPDLRYVTQAGGRLAPEQVRHYAELGQRHGLGPLRHVRPDRGDGTDGLPAAGSGDHPTAGDRGAGARGRAAVRTRHRRCRPDVGELVYTGPNVMLGYADGPADLALGRTVDELRTGDLARRAPDGLYEIVGRCSRFAKVFGLRIDLQRVEAGLESDGVSARASASTTSWLWLVQGRGRAGVPPRPTRQPAVRPAGPGSAGCLGARAASARVRQGRFGGRGGCRRTCPTRLEADDGDRPVHALRGGAGSAHRQCERHIRRPRRRLTVVRRDVGAARGCTGRAAGRLAHHGHPRPGRHRAPDARRWRRLDTGVALRAVAIVLIVGSHIGVSRSGRRPPAACRGGLQLRPVPPR